MTNKEADGDIHGECAAEIRQLEIALRIKTEEHDCCAKDLLLWRTSYESACTQNVHLCAKIDDCRPFLKEGESPAEGLARFRTKITEIFGRWTIFIDRQKSIDTACATYLKAGETAADALLRLTKELAAAAEQRERILPEVRLQRILKAVSPTQDEIDAARYRWLRANPNWVGFELFMEPDEMDASIDHEMRSAE